MRLYYGPETPFLDSLGKPENNGQYQRLPAAHPELCLGHGMAAVAHPEEETVSQGQIPAKAGHHLTGVRP
jgi:hypothetical protein